MKKINIEIDGKPYLVVTKDGKTELGIKGNTTPEKDEEAVVQVKNNCETSHQSRANCEKLNNVIKNERIQYEYFKRGAPDTRIW